MRLLQGQLDPLNAQKGKVEVNLGDTLTERETTVATLEIGAGRGCGAGP